MSLVRMTLKGVPKFVRATSVTRIAVDEDGTRVDYEPDEFDYVDGTPDEVFKALFNPPEMIEKALVDKEVRLASYLSPEQLRDVHRRMGIMGDPRLDTLVGVLRGLRERLGLPKEQY